MGIKFLLALASLFVSAHLFAQTWGEVAFRSIEGQPYFSTDQGVVGVPNFQNYSLVIFDNRTAVHPFQTVLGVVGFPMQSLYPDTYAFSPDNSLICGSFGGKTMVWEIQTSKVLYEFKNNYEMIGIFLPDNQHLLLASGKAPQNSYLVDARTGQRQVTLPPSTHANGDGTRLLVNKDDNNSSLGYDVYDTLTGQILFSGRYFYGWVNNNKRYFTTKDGGHFEIIDSLTGKMVFKLDVSGKEFPWRFSVDASGSKLLVITGDFNNYLALYDLKTGRQLWKIGDPTTSDRIAPQFSPDGTEILANYKTPQGDTKLVTIDTQTGQQTAEILSVPRDWYDNVEFLGFNYFNSGRRIWVDTYWRRAQPSGQAAQKRTLSYWQP